jgi:hypothetical protein
MNKNNLYIKNKIKFLLEDTTDPGDDNGGYTPPGNDGVEPDVIPWDPSDPDYPGNELLDDPDSAHEEEEGFWTGLGRVTRDAVAELVSDPFNYIPYSWPLGIVDRPDTYAYEHNPQTGQPYPWWPVIPTPPNGPSFPVGDGHATPGW